MNVKKDFRIEDYEVEVWKKELRKIEKELAAAKREYDDDPLTALLNCQMEFKELLDNNKGVQARTSPEFIAKVNELAKREKRAKKRHEAGISIITAGDDYYEVLWKRDAIAQKYANIEYMRNRNGK